MKNVAGIMAAMISLSLAAGCKVGPTISARRVNSDSLS